MGNIIECQLNSTYKNIYAGIWQYDYGQILRITGANLPTAVEVQFSLKETGGDTTTRIGATTDGVTEVQVPDELLKNGGCSRDYCIYAYIYVTDESSGNTEYKITLHVKTRSKPEEPTEEPSTETNIFHETVTAVNASADRAETAEKSAKESAETAKSALSGIKEVSDSLSGTVEQANTVDASLKEQIELAGGIQENVEQIEKNKTDIGSLNEELQSKLDSPLNPLVGRYLRVKAVNDDGIPELEWVDAPSGSSIDVKVAGKSIVQDGVAEIPVVTGYKTRGIVYIDSIYNGISVDDKGALRCTSYSNSLIQSRMNSIPVCAGYLDYAVKAAMCDGKGAAWTDVEKTGAWTRQNSIKTEMDDIAVAGAQYYLTEQTELAITLPDDALAGQEITIVWYNGESAANLSIDGNILDFDYVPSNNTRSELSCLWDGTYWCLICNEQSVPTSEVEDE